MMQSIFTIVYRILVTLSELTGLSYNEINIVVFFVIIPLIFLLLMDKIFDRRVFSVSFIIFVLISSLFIRDLRLFSDGLFDQSVAFLLGFEVLGLDYVASSVLVCVFLPMLIFFVLFTLAKSRVRSTSATGRDRAEEARSPQSIPIENILPRS